MDFEKTSPTTQKNYLTVEELAVELGVKTSWVRSMVFKKRIPYIKIGRLVRFKLKDLEEFIQNNSKSVKNE